MKKLSIAFLILINCIACSNGQIKPSLDNTQNLSTEILGCWRLVDAYHEIKSNYPNIDSLCLENRKLYIDSEKENPIIAKFSENNRIKFYSLDGEQIDQGLYYKIENDSLCIEDINSLRLNTKSTSQISISNDTLYIQTNIPKELDKIIRDLVSDDEVDIAIFNYIEFNISKRYAMFVRVLDCDQYKKEDE